MDEIDGCRESVAVYIVSLMQLLDFEGGSKDSKRVDRKSVKRVDTWHYDGLVNQVSDAVGPSYRARALITRLKWTIYVFIKF